MPDKNKSYPLHLGIGLNQNTNKEMKVMFGK